MNSASVLYLPSTILGGRSSSLSLKKKKNFAVNFPSGGQVLRGGEGGGGGRGEKSTLIPLIGINSTFSGLNEK
jgi:hypothetical protein